MAAFAQEGITDEKTQIALLANIKKESGFKPISENLNYTSTARLKEVFPSKTKNLSDEELKRYTNNPEGLAELVYGGRMGNTEPGDGFKYRGRGFIQLTGKNNYASMGAALNLPLVDNPDLANEPVVAARIAARYIKDANLRKSFNTQEEANRAVTQSIGGRNLNLDSGYGATLLSKVNSYAGDITLASSGTSLPNQSAAAPNAPSLPNQSAATLIPNAPSSATTLAAATTAVSQEKMTLASAAPVVNNVTNNNVNNTTAGGQSQGALPSVYDDMFSSLFQRVA
jgi:predicted chitinase